MPDGMHIVYVTSEFIHEGALYPGGLSTYTYNVSRGLIRRGHRVTVFMNGDRDCITEFEGITVHECATDSPALLQPILGLLHRQIPTTVDRVLTSLSVNRKLKAFLRDNPVDVIHYTNWKSIGLFGIRSRSLIRISSYEPLWDNNPDNDHLDKRLMRRLEKWSIRRFRRIIGPGDHLARIIETDLGMKRPITILPTPAPSNIPVTPPGRWKDAGEKLIVYAGTVSRVKGAELLFQLVGACLSELPGTKFLIAGKAGNINGVNCADRLKELESRFPDRCLYRRNLSREDLMCAFAESDIVVIPSLIDNFPNTALEAMRMKAVVVASHTASLGMLIQDGRNGYIVKDRELESWMHRIRFVLHGSNKEAVDGIRSNIPDSLVPFEEQNALDRLIAYYEGCRDKDS